MTAETPTPTEAGSDVGPLTTETGQPVTVTEAARYYAWALNDRDPYRSWLRCWPSRCRTMRGDLVTTEAGSDVGALTTALHAERSETNTRNVDCWACEAARSKTVADLLTNLRRAQAAASHANAVLARAVPDEEAQAELWRAHWREQLSTLREATS